MSAIIKFPITIVVSDHPQYGSITYTIEEKLVNPEVSVDAKTEIVAYIKIANENPVEHYRSSTPTHGIQEIEDSLYEALLKIFAHINRIGVPFYTRRDWVTIKFLIQHYCLNLLFEIVERKVNHFTIDGSQPNG